MRWLRFLLWVGLVGVGMIIWALQLYAQPEDILLDDHSVFTSRERPPAAFRHMFHISNGIDSRKNIRPSLFASDKCALIIDGDFRHISIFF